MKKIFTLCFIGAIMLCNTSVFSQTLNEHFENDSNVLAADCWQFLGTRFARNTGPTSSYVINSIGSVYALPPVSGDSIRIMRTPLLNVGSSLNVSFNYKLSNSLGPQQKRTIEVALTNNAGAIMQSFATINMNATTNNTTSVISFNQTYTVATPGIYRLAIIISGSTGGGNARISIDDFSESAISLGCPANSTLPVKLVSFSGNLNNGKVNLQWTVAENEMDDRFEVEKSVDGKAFKTAAVVFASTKPGAEAYSLNETMNTEKIYYRLKMFDKNQVINYSKTIVFEEKAATGGNNVKIINNPATDKLTLSFSSANNQPVEIKIYDFTGRLQMDQKTNAYKGNNLISLPLNSAFRTGMYAVEVINGQEKQTTKFLKQ